MARGKRIIGIDALNQQIETAEAEVIKAKKRSMMKQQIN